VDPSGRTALVTGASSGIGRATALALARAGAKLELTGRDPVALEEVARATGGTFLAADLAEPRAVDELAGWAGPVDILVNNAGFGLAGVFTSQDPGEIRSVIDVNLAAPVLLARALLPQMVERGTGHVINVGSVAGHVGVQGEAVYAATKGALIAFGESLRYELQGSGVAVTTVSPGVIATSFFEREGLPYTRRFPRPIPPERVAKAVVAAIRHRRPQVFVPRWMAFPVWLRGTAPWLYRQGASRWG
jgi:short-subunit dehydrogenase